MCSVGVVRDVSFVGKIATQSPFVYHLASSGRVGTNAMDYMLLICYTCFMFVILFVPPNDHSLRDARGLVYPYCR
jgi:hypothetical protein